MAAAKKTAAAKTAAPAKRTREKKVLTSPDQIAERAYFLHLERGGDELENWLTAERELATA